MNYWDEYIRLLRASSGAADRALDSARESEQAMSDSYQQTIECRRKIANTLLLWTASSGRSPN